MSTGTNIETLYKHHHECLADTWKSNIVGNNRKTFQNKYGCAMKHMMLHVIRACKRHRIKCNPMMIAFKYTVPDSHDLIYDLCTNTITYRQDNGMVVEIEMAVIHSTVITSLTDDYPDRIYLFHASEVQPKDISQHDLKVMAVSYCKIVVSCSTDTIKLNGVQVKHWLDDKGCECDEKDVKILKLTAHIKELEARLASMIVSTQTCNE